MTGMDGLENHTDTPLAFTHQRIVGVFFGLLRGVLYTRPDF